MRILFLSLLFLSLQDPRRLQPGQTIESELRGAEKHRWVVALAERQYVRAIVEQIGIDVRAQAFGADGGLLAEFNREPFVQGQENVEIVSTGASDYYLSIEPTQQNSAGRYRIRIAESRPATDTDYLLQEARTLRKQGDDLMRAGRYDAARSLLEKAAGIRESLQGPDHLEVAVVLLALGTTHYFQRRLDQSELLFERAASIFEKTLGPDHPFLATTLNNLANLYQVRNEVDKSEALHLRALAIRERSLGEDHPEVAQTLNNLANLYSSKGAVDKVESLYERAIAINEKVFGPDDITLASPLANFAGALRKKGDYAKAESLLQRALRIRENRWGPEHPDVATALVNLAEIYRETGDERAQPFHQRALAMREKLLGADHPDVAKSLSYLGLIYGAAGEPLHAEALLQRSLAIKEKAQGPEHPDVISGLVHLADLYSARGDYAEAEPLYLRALAGRLKASGPQHPDLAASLSGLARLTAATGRISDAVGYQSRALSVNGYNLDLNLATGSERQKLIYLGTQSKHWDQAISLNAVFAPNDRAASELALTTILQLKGRVQDAVGESFATLRQRLGSEGQALLDRLNDTNGQLAGAVLDGPRGTLEEHQKTIARLEEQKEKIEREISERSKGFYTAPKPVTASLIQGLIPPDAALVEFALYRRSDLRSPGSQPLLRDERYAAYVLRPDGELQFTDLGPSQAIDDAIAAFRGALRDPRRRDSAELARKVDEKVMRPVRRLLGGASHLLISPDGALNLIPFPALMDEQQRYLIERWSITYLTSGRDLVRLEESRPGRGARPLVLAAPAFGETEAGPRPGTGNPGAKPHAPGRGRVRQSVTAGSDLSDIYFAPLPATAQEARALQSLFRDSIVLTGKDATESALKQGTAPSMLHIATHGFFLDGRSGADTAGRRGIRSAAQIENPLLRSGLALAGANRQTHNAEDGILTAMEAAGLNLWGTKLVTLSACDTGLGEIKNGEGVYGLRRSFVLAGAETLLMSLWAVSDQVTGEIMTAYYTGLKQGQGRGEALRQVQLRMLQRTDRRHPFYWAGFIQSGKWSRLEE